MQSPKLKIIFVVLSVCFLAVLAIVIAVSARPKPTLSISDLAKAINEGRVKSVSVMNETDVTVTMVDGSVAYITKEGLPPLTELLAERGVSTEKLNLIAYTSASSDQTAVFIGSVILPILQVGIFVLPVLLIVGIFYVGKRKRQLS